MQSTCILRGSTMRYALMAFTLLTAACGTDGSGTGPSPSTQINGNWQFQTTFGNQALQASCQAAGQATIQQTGAGFTGQVNGAQPVCTGAFISNPSTGTITGGQVSGGSVSFTLGPCTYSGSVASGTMSGTNRCSLTVSEIEHTFSGTWQMRR
jgi:hypothetical protein